VIGLLVYGISIFMRILQKEFWDLDEYQRKIGGLDWDMHTRILSSNHTCTDCHIPSLAESIPMEFSKAYFFVTLD
jgi:hypothetical protein